MVNYTLQYWQLYQATYDGLLAFQKVGGQPSFTVVPDLATALPTVTNGGKTYRFTLRNGIKFSTGKAVTTDDVVASFRRIFTVSSPTAGTFYNGIVGAAACLKTPKTCTLAGSVVGDAAARTVTINLTAPDPELPYKLAVPHATVLPAGSPATDSGTKPLPGTGAYTIASYNPSGNGSLVLQRNPNFTEWSRAAQPQGYPDTIVESFGQTVESEITAVQNGQADWLADQPPADRLNELGTKFADQIHVNELTAFWYLPMNTRIPPFNNVKARQAVNYAVDRDAVVQLYGGKNLAAPVCTILPPGFPGHADSCQYTKNPGTAWSAPDLDKARQLVQESGTAGQAVTVVVQDDAVNSAIGEYVQSVLNDIGYKAKVNKLSGNIQFTYIQNTKNKVQISLSQWYQDRLHTVDGEPEQLLLKREVPAHRLAVPAAERRIHRPRGAAEPAPQHHDPRQPVPRHQPPHHLLHLGSLCSGLSPTMHRQLTAGGSTRRCPTGPGTPSPSTVGT
jgi:peptide/nickel transport system substrate-binding protein